VKLSKSFQAFIEKEQLTDSFWAEEAKLDFAFSLEQQRRIAGMSYAAIAKKLGTSSAYVSKVFRGDVNLTIESMVKLVRATDGKIN